MWYIHTVKYNSETESNKLLLVHETKRKLTHIMLRSLTQRLHDYVGYLQCIL